jgi:hypothetical protein
MEICSIFTFLISQGASSYSLIINILNLVLHHHIFLNNNRNNVDSALCPLQGMDLLGVADVSVVHVASVFRAEESNMSRVFMYVQDLIQ